MPTILLTAFEPFAGADVNPSARVAESLAAEAISGARLVTATLPVVAAQVPHLLESLIETHRPDAILGLGEARGAPHVRVERLAANLLDFSRDNAGATALDAEVIPGGPAAYWATWPARAVRDAVLARGVACVLSTSAGTFCCNQLLYLALHHVAARNRPTPVGFLHLPSLPEQAVPGLPALPLERQVEAVEAALDVVAGQLGPEAWSEDAERAR